MAMNDAGVLSNYRELTMINTEHGISLVQHIATDRVYVLKTLDVYKADIYRYLQANPVRGIPEIEEVIEHNGRLTIIEEYISGQTLRSILDNGNLFSEKDAVRIIEELCGRYRPDRHCWLCCPGAIRFRHFRRTYRHLFPGCRPLRTRDRITSER